MSLDAVLFDLDDTLHDKSATLRAVSAAQFRDAHLDLLGVNPRTWESEYLRLNNLRIEKSEVFRQLGLTFALPSAVAKSLHSDFDRNLGVSAVAFPFTVALLTWCRSHGMKLGVVTNGRDSFQRSKIEGMGIAGLLDSIVTSGELGIKKPDVRIFQECLRQLGVPPSRAAFVGDSFDADMEPAISLGMYAVWKSNSESCPVRFSSPDLNEILNHLIRVA